MNMHRAWLLRRNGRIGATTVGCALAMLSLVLGTWPLTATAACTGKYAAMQSYAGKIMYDTHFLKAPLVATRLQRLPLNVRRHFKRNLDVVGPVQLTDCHLVVTSNAAHLGTVEDAILAVDLDSGNVIAGIHTRGHEDVYVIRGPSSHAQRAAWNDLPMPVQRWTVMADMGFPSQKPEHFTQPATVRLHQVTTTASDGKAAVLPAVKVTDNVKPSATQAAAVARAVNVKFAPCNPSHPSCYTLSLADINADRRPDLLVSFTPKHAGMECGRVGCGGVIVLATAHGYADKAIDLPYFHEMDVLPDMHNGMHVLQFDRNSPLWLWNGNKYAIQKGAGAQPGAGTTPWKAWQAAGRTLAKADPINSTIKSVIVLCNQGKPLLAMLRKMPLSAKAVTLTWVFNGRTVNVPLHQGNPSATLWQAELASSPLPKWLAHSGIDYAYLRINGDMDGVISLKNSVAATQAALGACYHY